MSATQSLIDILAKGHKNVSDIYTHETGVQYFFETYTMKANRAIANAFKKATVENFVRNSTDFNALGFSFHIDRNPHTGELGNVYGKKLVKIL